MNYDQLLIMLVIVLFFRSSFIIICRLLNKYFGLFQKKNSFLSKYCKLHKTNPWEYRIWGFSTLWIIVYICYNQDKIEHLIRRLLCYL